MKKYLFLLIVILCSLNISAQTTTINESFENYPFVDWSTYEYGDDHPWRQDWQLEASEGSHSAHVYISNTALDSWMVSSQIDVSSNDYTLNFWELHDDEQYYVNTTVLISTLSGDPADGDFVEVYTTPDTATVWTEVSIDLSAYAGELIYVAYRYEGTWHKWFIDEVKVNPTSFANAGLVELVSPVGVSELSGMQNVTVNVENLGNILLDNVTIEWTVNGASQIPYTNNSLNLAEGLDTNVFIGSYDFNTAGLYEIEMIISSPNDINSINDTLVSYYSITTPKDGELSWVTPEAMSTTTGVQDVAIELINVGDNIIEELSVGWTIDGVSQTTYNANGLSIAVGETTSIVIGQYDFSTGVYEIDVNLNVFGDINDLNDNYLSYAAIDTFWESFEGREFVPTNWTIDFGVLDNTNFGPSAHGDKYYSSFGDVNFFGTVEDTIYTPLLDIVNGDYFAINIERNSFNATNNALIAKDPITGIVTEIAALAITPNADWTELIYDISSVAGVNHIGIATWSSGSGHTKFDLFHSSAKLHVDDRDLKILNGDLHYLALDGVNESFECEIQNVGNLPITGTDYAVVLRDEAGTFISAGPGVNISPNETKSMVVNHTFNGTGKRRLHLEISYLLDENLTNNSFRSSDVHVVPNTVVNETIGNLGIPNPSIPFTSNGSTMSLGEDDLSQILYKNSEITTSGLIWGFVYTYDNLLQSETVKHLPLKVWASSTSLENLNDGWTPTNELTLVYDDTLEILPGYAREIYIPFDTAMIYTGLENLIIQDYQYDPEWPPSIVRFYDNDVGVTSEARTIFALDVYQLDPYDQPDFNNSFEFTPHTQFIIEPILENSILAGVVSDGDGNPINGVEINIEGTDIIVLTNSNGEYEFPELPYGNYTIVTNILGYNDYSVSLDLNTDNVTHDITLLEKISINLTAFVSGSNAPNEPLENVLVEATGYIMSSALTNSAGNFSLDSIFSGSEYAITFSMYGYYDTTIFISNLTADLDFDTIVLKQEFISVLDVYASHFNEPVLHWKNPLESAKVTLQNDLGECTNWYTNEPDEDVWLGNIFTISDITTLTSVSFRTAIFDLALDSVSIDIFDLDANIIASSKKFIVYADSLHVIDIPNIVVYEDVYAMIHWQGNPASTSALCADYSDSTMMNSSYIKYPDQAFALLDSVNNNSFMVRLNTLDLANPFTNNEVLSYNVYKGLASEFPDYSNWTLLNDTAITDFSYTDNNWNQTLLNGYFRYAVEALYEEGEAEVTFSDSVRINWNGISDLWLDYDGIELYPVPANDILKVKIVADFEWDGSIQIYDILGRQIFTEKLNNKEKYFEISVNDFSNGNYFFVTKVDNKDFVKKIVVSH